MSDNETKEDDDKKNSNSAINLPLARVKRIIKSDTSIKYISTDSAVLIAKATVKSFYVVWKISLLIIVKELFIEYLSIESLKYTQADNRKILKYSDIGLLSIHYTSSLF